jgi:hypothetical protein
MTTYFYVSFPTLTLELAGWFDIITVPPEDTLILHILIPCNQQ